MGARRAPLRHAADLGASSDPHTALPALAGETEDHADRTVAPWRPVSAPALLRAVATMTRTTPGGPP
ncbi:MAG TPA: hypothetical protein VFM55_23730 [Micromonosporaceae bacterium]|nr:hypothetical protein [Micromonosporaceae bacterium]